MDVTQNYPNEENTTDVTTSAELESKYHEYAAFVGVGGLIVHADGSFKKMSLEEFARTHGVSRKTLYNWRKRKDFQAVVTKKRNEIFSVNSVSAVWNGVRLRAMKGDAEQAKLFLGQFADWQPPAQRQVHELGDSWSALVRQKRESLKVIEGETVDDATGSN